MSWFFAFSNSAAETGASCSFLISASNDFSASSAFFPSDKIAASTKSPASSSGFESKS